MYALEHDYSELKDGSAQRRFYAVFTRQKDRVTPSKTVQAHSVVLTHIQLKSFNPLSTHVRNCTRPSPALPYGKRQEAGRGPGNKAKQFANCILLYNFYYEILAIYSYLQSPQRVVLCMNSSLGPSLSLCANEKLKGKKKVW